MKTLLLLFSILLLAVTVMAEKIDFAPQPGPQELALRNPADIVIMGGGAGGGKTRAMLSKPIGYLNNGGFGAVIFRRETTQIRGEGGLWDESQKLYRYLGGTAREGTLDWRFPSGAKISFRHMERESDRFSYDGTQIALIGFDQLEHFTEKQFFYMLSRNRSTCGIRPRVFATCNPVPKDHKIGGWLHRLIQWWIDDTTGYAIPERSGKIRWFVNLDNSIVWADTKRELVEKFGDDCEPLSLTFVLAKLSDNPLMSLKDKRYRAKLQGLPKVERERLLGKDESKGGNWNATDAAGEFFQRGWFEIVDAAPGGGKDIRYWDRAATDETSPNAASASSTAGIRFRKMPSGFYYVCHMEKFKGSPGKVQERVKNVASQDGKSVTIGLEGDPGQAGKAEVQFQIRNLAGYNARANFVHESKGTRAKAVSAQAEAGNIKIVRGDWNEDFLKELENFDGSDTCVSDQVDALSGAFMMLTSKKEVKFG